MHFRGDFDVKRAAHSRINEHFIIEIEKIFKELNCNFFKIDFEISYQYYSVDVRTHFYHSR